MLKNISIILKRSGIAALGLMALAIVPGTAMAAGITVDGVRTDAETAVSLGGSGAAGDPLYENRFTTSWVNDHNSIYTSGTDMTDVYYTISNSGANLNLFVEASLYAKNIIWEGSDYKTAKYDVLTAQDKAEYAVNHHNPDPNVPANMSMDTMTKSEGVDFNNTTYDFDRKQFGKNGAPQTDTSKIQGGTDPTGASGDYWRTSLDWILSSDAGADQCTASAWVCVNDTGRNLTMSFEFLFTGLTGDGAQNIVTALVNDGLVFHISDERRNAPEVPVPAAFWLFGTAIFGLIGMRRKAKLAA